MLSPAASPRVQHQSMLRKHHQPTDKENAALNAVSSPRIGLSERVLQPSALSAYSSRDAKLLDILDDKQSLKRRFDDVKPVEGVGVLPRKRRFSDSAHGSGLPGSGSRPAEDVCKRVKKRTSRTDERSNEGGHTSSAGARVNPFDKPLRPVAQTAAPVRAYRRKAVKPRCAGAVTDPPPRALVSYEGLWDGVSCVEGGAAPQWDDDGFRATYDFLYDGVWTRCVGRLVIPVEKEVEDPSLEKGFSCGWRWRRFRDLDRPASFDAVWET